MNPELRITCPVMRFVGTADPVRSAAFYRDTLGFEIKDDGTEAHRGPARIRFGDHGYPPLDWENPRPPGSEVLFFEVNDAAAWHAAITSRGGAPSAIERVNWIKLSVFEVRDPDGNKLWFGQSYHEATDSPGLPPGQRAGLRQALPELPFDDVPAAVKYYCDVLGFRINYAQDDIGVMDRDAITILLIARDEKRTGIGSFEVYIDDADALHAELSAKGANVQGPPVSRPWGLRDFSVLDLEGNRITFAQTFE